MYDFHYNYVKRMYGDRAKLLFTDTDSLMYEIQTEDFYHDINPDVHDKFDRSNYPQDHPSGIETGVNKKVIGMFKDEARGKQIVEFVGMVGKGDGILHDSLFDTLTLFHLTTIIYLDTILFGTVWYQDG